MIDVLTIGGAAACGATVAMLLSSFFNGNAQAHGSWCVVRIHKRPALYEILYESRSPGTSRRFAKGVDRADTVMILRRSEVDAFNAKQTAKPAFFVDLRSLLSAYAELIGIRNSEQYVEDEVSPDFMAAIAALEKKVDERFKNTAEILLREIRDVDERLLQATGEIRVAWRDPVLPTLANRPDIEPPSVMPQMTPTEAMSRAEIEQGMRRPDPDPLEPLPPRDPHATNPNLFGQPFVRPEPDPSHERFEPEQHPTAAHGMPVLKNGDTIRTTRTVIIPLGDPPLPKRPE